MTTTFLILSPSCTLLVQHSIFFYNLVSCCLAINIVVHWALKAILTVLLSEQLFERLCNILWCCVVKIKLDELYSTVFFPPSSAPLVLILDRVYLRWCIVSMTTQTSRCTRVVYWPPKWGGEDVWTHTITSQESHGRRVKSEGVWCVWICYVIEGVVGYGIKVCCVD